MGDTGLAARVDRCFDLAAHLAERVRSSGGAFVLAAPPSCTNVCFWFVPPPMRPLPPPSELARRDHPIHLVAPHVKEAMQRGGRALVGFQAIDVGGQPLPNFFRFVASNCDTVSREHIDEMLADIAAIGAAFELPATRDSPSASRDHTSTPYAKRPPGAKARAKARAFVATA